MAIKMRVKMKSRIQRYDINSVRPRPGHKYAKLKLCLTIIMFICIKQNLSNISS